MADMNLVRKFEEFLNQQEAPPHPLPYYGEGYTFRLATDEAGNHGYEIGYWLMNPDGTFTEPANFVVVDKLYGQEEAAARVRVLSTGGNPNDPKVQDKPKPPAKAADDEDDEDSEADEPHRTVTRTRTVTHKR